MVVRSSAVHGLEVDQAEPLMERRRREDVGGGEELVFLLLRDETSEAHSVGDAELLRECFEVAALRPVAQDEREHGLDPVGTLPFSHPLANGFEEG